MNDFAKESFIDFIESYYMKPYEIISCRNIPLYVGMPEDVTHIYYLTTTSSDWVRGNLDYDEKCTIVTLVEKFM